MFRDFDLGKKYIHFDPEASVLANFLRVIASKMNFSMLFTFD